MIGFSLIRGVFFLLPALCFAENIGVIVPSYFYPGTGGPGGNGDGWAAMTAAASQVQVTAILNPNSGPLSGPADSNYITAMTNLENAGGKVIAYVDTASGSAPLATVEGEISTYIGQYGSLIDGFFLDDMSVVPGTLAYYQTLDSYVKGLHSSYLVVGNPGQPFLNGVTPANYLSTADVLDTFEGPNTAPPGDAGFNNYPYGLNWFENYESSEFETIIYDVPTSTDMLADLDEAAELNAGYVYITDEGGANPYSQLPSYWDQEVATLAATPEPSTLPLLALGGIIACTMFAVRRFAR
jgi:hypothetical protein